MPTQLTGSDFQQSLNSHVAVKGDELHDKYGPDISWGQLQSILQDRSLVRYPCRIVFDASPLQPGEFAHAMSEGDAPEQGFTLYIHPSYSSQLDKVPYLALYHLVVVNYGEFASADDAETFAANALGLPKDAYYQELCELADQLGCSGAPCVN
jgi:hypothetical protein